MNESEGFSNRHLYLSYVYVCLGIGCVQGVTGRKIL
jgi:hypothetical protein